MDEDISSPFSFTFTLTLFFCVYISRYIILFISFGACAGVRRVGGEVLHLKENGGLGQIWIEICSLLIISGADSNTSFCCSKRVSSRQERVPRKTERERER